MITAATLSTIVKSKMTCCIGSIQNEILVHGRGAVRTSSLVRCFGPTGSSMIRSLFSSSSIRSKHSSASSTPLQTTVSRLTSHPSDRCNRHIIKSPYPPIPSGPYPPFFEFITNNWDDNATTLNIEIVGNKISIIDTTTGDQRTFRDQFVTAGNWAATLMDELNIHTEGPSAESAATSTNNIAVAVYMPNHVDYLPIVLGTALCGGTIVPIHPQYTSMELEHVLKKSKAQVVVTHSQMVNTALEAIKSVSEQVKFVVVVPSPDAEIIPSGTLDFNSIRYRHNDEEGSPPFYETKVIGKEEHNDRTLILPFSSGTTGLPKGVCLTTNNMISNLLQTDVIEGKGLKPHHTLISPLPFFHIYGLTISLLYAAWKGNTLITNSGPFDLEAFCKAVEDYQPKRAHLVPPIILGLAKHPVVTKYDMSSLRKITSGAAPMGAELELAVAERLGGCCDVKQGWGATEMSPLASLNPDDDIRHGSAGPLAPSTVGKVVDQNGHSLGPNEQGELLIKGPQVMSGYLNDPVSTSEAISPSGWFRTGDLGYYDEDGNIFITDRIKELIKVKGFPVAPAELEELLLSHPAVKDSAVVQAPSDEAGEVPRAYIVLSEKANKITEQDIYDWVKERVAPYKRLDGGVEFIDVIPRSASGKILRRLLRQQYEASLEEQEQWM